MSLADAYIIFELAGAAYAVRSSDVQHVALVEQVTPVPNTAPAVDGVVFSRGQVAPVINLRVRFGLPRTQATTRSRLIFLNVHGRIVGLLVDSAREFQRIPEQSVQPAQESLVGIAGNYVAGIATHRGRSILILDLSRVLTLEETQTPETPLSQASS